jgi:hypothetical protein
LIGFAAFSATDPSMSRMATAAPSAASAFAVAVPIAPPGDERHLPGQRRHPRFGFAAQGLNIRVRSLSSGGRNGRYFGVGDHAHGVLGEIGGHVGILRRAADAEQAKTRHEHHARRRVELGFDPANPLVLAAEIGIVVGGELCDFLLNLTGEVVELAWLRRRKHERRVLGADDVVRRDHTALAVVVKLGAIHIAENLRRGAERHDETRRLAAGLVGRQRHGASDDRRHLGNLCKLGG